MASKGSERKPKAAGRRKQGRRKAVGIYERPGKKKKNHLALLLAIIIIMAMVLSLVLAGRL